MRSPLSEQLGPKIALLPEVQAAVTSGTATLHEHNALALVNCCSPEDALKIYQAATTPLRHPQEPLNLTTVRVEHQWRTAAAIHCEPNPAGRFWALFSVLTPAERQLFTNLSGIQARLVVSLGQSPEAAKARHAALLSELLNFASAQHTTSPAGGGAARGSGGGGGGGGCGGGCSGGGGGGGGSNSRRRDSTTRGARSGRGGAWGSRPSTPRPASAASAAPSDAASSDSDDSAAAPASAAPAAGASEAAPWNYTGNRANDAVETARRRAGHLCLKCLPGGPISRLPCPLHPPRPAREHRSSAARCFPFAD